MGLLYLVLYPLSLLPFSILYFISDICAALLFSVLRYRRAVVIENLTLSFPAKTKQEIHAIAKQFYKGFCDHWIETLKLLSLSPQELNKRMVANWEVFDELNKKDKDCYALVGHMFNWEWLNVAWQYNIPQQYACFYSPVSSTAFDKLMYKIRSGSGALLISMKAKKGLQKLQNIRFVLGLAADQSPSDIKNAKWLPFMNREAAFFQGPEKLARRANGAVVFTSITKVERGKYHVHFEVITEAAAELPQGEITQRYVQFLEQQLHAQPTNWLWSHRRWKHTHGS